MTCFGIATPAAVHGSGGLMAKVKRNMSTPEARAFWEEAERGAAERKDWPDWKRAGINVAQTRSTPRVVDCCDDWIEVFGKHHPDCKKACPTEDRGEAMTTANEQSPIPTTIDIETGDPLMLRVAIQAMVDGLNRGPKSRARSLAVTKLEEAAMWLNEAMRTE